MRAQGRLAKLINADLGDDLVTALARKLGPVRALRRRRHRIGVSLIWKFPAFTILGTHKLWITTWTGSGP